MSNRTEATVAGYCRSTRLRSRSVAVAIVRAAVPEPIGGVAAVGRHQGRVFIAMELVAR
jgi:hypothetical protein